MSKHGALYPWTVLIKGVWWLCLAPVKTVGSAAEYFNIPVLNVLPGWDFRKAYPEDYPENYQDESYVYGDSFLGTRGAGFKRKPEYGEGEDEEDF